MDPKFMAHIGLAIIPESHEAGLEARLAQSGWRQNGINVHQNGAAISYRINNGIAIGEGYLRAYKNKPGRTGLMLIVVATTAESVTLLQGEARELLYGYLNSIQVCPEATRKKYRGRVRKPEQPGA